MNKNLGNITRLLVISSSFPRNEVNSDGNHVYSLAKYLSAENKFRVTVLCPHNKGLPIRDSRENLEVYRFRYFFPTSYQNVAYGEGIPYNVKNSLLAKIEFPLFVLSELLSAIRIIRAKKIDLIYTHWLIPQGLVGAICQKLLKIPHVAIIHSSEITLLRQIPFGRQISDFITENSKKIVSVSNHRYNELLHIISPQQRETVINKSHIVPMGVNLERFERKQEKTILRKKYNIDDNCCVILFVGRLVEVKGIEYLIHGFSYVLSKKKNTKLIIVGGGALLPDLRGLAEKLKIEENILFTGTINADTVPEFYLLSNIFVFPSIVDSSGYEEGLPKVVLEASAAGNAIVATKTNGVMEIIKDGFNGILVNQKNSKEIGEAIIYLIENPDEAKRLSENARRQARNFDWLEISGKYAEIIRGALSE